MMEAKSQVTVITTIDGFMDELPSEAEIKGDILDHFQWGGAGI